VKILISEEQHYLLIEASKKDILIQKIGLNERNAEFLSNLCGPLSVFITNKIIDNMMATEPGIKKLSREEVIAELNSDYTLQTSRQTITSIMDWIRVGLNGNVKPYQNLSYKELHQQSKKWHDELQVGGSTIDYKEEHPVVIDFRNEKGNGYYWVDLESKDCDEESKRMGHCGRSAGNLYSLRFTSPIENTKFTKNKSYVTASVNDSGVLLQMKGPHNKKPSEELHSYIIPFILNDIVNEFGSEYQSSEDFSLTDLPEDKISEIYDQKPDLFDNRKGKKALRKIGLLSDRTTEDMMFELQIDPAYISRYVDGDWTVRKYKDANGRQRETGMFETLLSGDYWDLFDNGGGEWETALEYYADDENTGIIWDLIKGFTNEDEIEGKSLNELIKEFDNNYEIRNALGNAISSAESDSYYVYYKRTLQNALEEYGNVTKLNDEGATIEINLKTVIDNHGVNEDDLDDYFERCEDSYECVFDELMGDYYEKPDFRIDDRWTPDVDERYFNETLNDYLGDVRL
jgi:hypothetical protein